MNSNTRSTEDWEDWYAEAKDEEKEIYNLICDYKGYFKDLTLQEGSCTYTIFEKKVEFNLQVFFDNLVVRVKNFENPYILAYYNSKDHIVTVSPKVKTEQYCIPHEMIHMLDTAYDMVSGLRDAVKWRLYYDLREKINGLDQAILDFTKFSSLLSINRCIENPRVLELSRNVQSKNTQNLG